ncbi:MAG: energy-coupling factor transporter transmembrane protein EcfT [Paracoccaceae bacterium]|nr:energy-coupling factor transporter transmembrane protein EcfT [Paracoccaceae bacterium]
MLTLTSPVETRLHHLPAGAKLGFLAAATLVLMPLADVRLVAAALVAVAGLYLAQGRPFAAHGVRMLRSLWPFLLVLAVWHGWIGDAPRGALIAGKMLTAVGLANLVTMTTRLDDMVGVLERLARPLGLLGLRPRLIALAVALVIRFTPVLMEKAAQLVDAWRARSPRRAGWRLVVPITLIALDDADHVAEALRARGGV